MNDVILKELKIVVERAVRPVRATLARKRKMREELLAHLMAIFEEEMQKAGGERAALDQAKRRFGNPKELTTQLQQSVPRWDRISFIVEDFLCFRVGESALRHAARVAVLPWMWCPVVCLLVPLVSLIRGRGYEISRMMFTLVAAGALVSGIVLILTLSVHGVRNRLYCEVSRRSIPLAMVQGVLSALLLPIGAFLLSWTASNDVASAFAHSRLLWCFSLLVPILLVLIARGIEKDRRYQEEWKRLEVGE